MTYPAYEPTDRRYVHGEWPISRHKFMANTEQRVLHATRKTGQELRLTYANQTTEAIQIFLYHYDAMYGMQYAFELPPEVYAGWEGDKNLLGRKQLWQYKDVPRITSQKGQIATLQVTLVVATSQAIRCPDPAAAAETRSITPRNTTAYPSPNDPTQCFYLDPTKVYKSHWFKAGITHQYAPCNVNCSPFQTQTTEETDADTWTSGPIPHTLEKTRSMDWSYNGNCQVGDTASFWRVLDNDGRNISPERATNSREIVSSGPSGSFCTIGPDGGTLDTGSDPILQYYIDIVTGEKIYPVPCEAPPPLCPPVTPTPPLTPGPPPGDGTWEPTTTPPPSPSPGPGTPAPTPEPEPTTYQTTCGWSCVRIRMVDGAENIDWENRYSDPNNSHSWAYVKDNPLKWCLGELPLTYKEVTIDGVRYSWPQQYFSYQLLPDYTLSNCYNASSPGNEIQTITPGCPTNVVDGRYGRDDPNSEFNTSPLRHTILKPNVNRRIRDELWPVYYYQPQPPWEAPPEVRVFTSYPIYQVFLGVAINPSVANDEIQGSTYMPGWRFQLWIPDSPERGLRDPFMIDENGDRQWSDKGRWVDVDENWNGGSWNGRDYGCADPTQTRKLPPKEAFRVDRAASHKSSRFPAHHPSSRTYEPADWNAKRFPGAMTGQAITIPLSCKSVASDGKLSLTFANRADSVAEDILRHYHAFTGGFETFKLSTEIFEDWNSSYKSKLKNADWIYDAPPQVTTSHKGTSTTSARLALVKYNPYSPAGEPAPEPEPPIQMPGSRIQIFIDDSGSMETLETFLRDMVPTTLKKCLLPHYGGDESLYADRVRVIYMGQDLLTSERCYRAAYWIDEDSSGQSPTTEMINIIFQDESSLAYIPDSRDVTDWTINSPRELPFEQDINTLRSRVNAYRDPDYAAPSQFNAVFGPDFYNGFIFKVINTEYYKQDSIWFGEFLEAVEKGQGNYTGTYSSKDIPELKYIYDIPVVDDQYYYMNLIIDAINSLGYNVPKCR